MKTWKMLFAVAMMVCFAGNAFGQTPQPDPIGEEGPPVVEPGQSQCDLALAYIQDIHTWIGWAECDLQYLQYQFEAAAAAANAAYEAFQDETDLEAKAALGEIYLEKVRLMTEASAAAREKSEALSALRVLLEMARWYHQTLGCWA